MREVNKLLDALLNRYEESVSFTGNNKVSQNISIRPEKLFPAYADDSQYEVFENVNAAVCELEKMELVKVKRLKNGVVEKLILALDKLDEAYAVLGRTPKKDIHRQLKDLWEDLLDELNKEQYDPFYPMLSSYVEKQKERISKNKQIEYFEGDITEYKKLLRAIHEIVNNEKEQFVRDFSVRLFGDSKKLKQYEDKIRAFLYEYGESSEREVSLEEYGIVKTPTYVAIKGEAILYIGGQKLDLSRLNGDISLSTITMEQVEHIDITAKKVVTIENLTSFHTFNVKDFFAIYLGGYHNNAKRQFLSKVYESNPDKEYYHFGDIDAGGFYIYEHLLRKSKIPFKPLAMDLETLIKNKAAWKELSQNDRNRIKALLKKASSESYKDVLLFMLDNNCKLEQEAVVIEI
mgnify:CR=1 FL=1